MTFLEFNDFGNFDDFDNFGPKIFFLYYTVNKLRTVTDLQSFFWPKVAKTGLR